MGCACLLPLSNVVVVEESHRRSGREMQREAWKPPALPSRRAFRQRQRRRVAVDHQSDPAILLYAMQ